MAETPIPLFLDCDPGIDDAIAIAYLLCQPDIELVGLAASGGNVPTAQVVHNTLGWLELAGRTDLPVYRGAELPLAGIDVHAVADAPAGAAPETPSGDPEYAEVTHGDTGAGYAVLPEPTTGTRDASAAQAWVDAARAHPGELIGVVIGPNTNLALALEIEPDLPRLLKRLFIMGGAFNYRGNTHPTTEWNITFDPEAAAQVIAAFGAAFTAGDAAFPPVIGPIEATEMVEMTPERLSRILDATRATPATPSAADPAARGSLPDHAVAAWPGVIHALGEALRFYFEFHEADGHGYLAHTHDPVVVAAAVGWARAQRASTRVDADPAAADTIPWAATVRAPVDVELTGTLTRGETVADWLGRWNRPANAEIIRSIDAPRFLDHLEETLMKGPHYDRTR